ncbi:two-component sensor histidine kinase [Streptomyces sp. CB02923]|uniref:sensor histidine kinase n=1 Tax=Streptomyces sp. CB02923 TaxID=1718985 RepID=UPI00093CF186|nr:HAMP domain-containing sensor histidine kinase [Streptomyces sp. CB02923]OKI03508.1 two-component sensor histidine kinase [Streptomyces sp. CB02923]
MTRPALSLRWKIALTVTAVCCAVAAVLGVLVHNAVARQTVGQVRKETLSDLDDALDLYEYGTSREGLNSVLDPGELPVPLRTLVHHDRRGSMVGIYHGQRVMWTAAPAGDQVMAVWSPYENTRRSLENLDTAIFGSAVLAATAVALAGLFLAHRISRRLSTTAAVARRITAGDLDARVGTEGEGRTRTGATDEVAAVAAALDSVAGSLQGRLQAEQRFTADVAHELRTPLTGILASAELLPEGRPKEMINDRLRALHRLTEDLLEISRLDSGAEHPDLASYELGTLVRRSVEGLGLDTEVRIVRDGVVRTDRRRLDRILCNLVLNAHRHGRPPVVVTVDVPGGAGPGGGGAHDDGPGVGGSVVGGPMVGGPVGGGAFAGGPVAGGPVAGGPVAGGPVAGGHFLDEGSVPVPVVEVRDHGPGFPDELLHRGPQRFRTDAPGRGKGHGLGLTIAVGQAAVLGIGLLFTNAPDGGARAVLRLTPATPPPPGRAGSPGRTPG